MQSRLKVLLICGPSGVGKGTLANLLLKDFPHAFGFSVSHTTREPRPGEQDGVDYHFTAHEQIKSQIAAGRFAEHAQVHGEVYGTSFESLEAVHKQNKICLLDVDLHGVRSIKPRSDLNFDAKCVGIVPPTLGVLERRLRERRSENESQIRRRMARARIDIQFVETDRLIDEVIVNFNSWEHGYPRLRDLVTKKFYPDLLSSSIYSSH
mmetsp:Transcript_12534/g.15559  ORF Transcript_12534/g.15559 Transcript_12534/m.15559 type:complete len:208 (+) Transcript_12534:157-780(+)